MIRDPRKPFAVEKSGICEVGSKVGMLIALQVRVQILLLLTPIHLGRGALGKVCLGGLQGDGMLAPRIIPQGCNIPVNEISKGAMFHF